MLYPNDIEVKLGFDQIRALLKAKCKSLLGQEMVERMKVSADYELVNKLLHQTDEFTRLITTDEPFPTEYYLDVRESLRQSKVPGAFLDERQFKDISRSLTTVTKAVRFLESKKEEYPYLNQLSHVNHDCFDLVSQIDSKIDDEARVKDNASSELQRVRKSISQKHNEVRKTLDAEFKAALKEGFVPDGATITVRDGRMVIPLAAEYKRRVKGFVHDESATGQTVFIEPTSVLEGNNELRELEYAEKREKVRILTQLTDLLRGQLDSLRSAYKFLSFLDFIQAKAKLAIELEAIRPNVRQGAHVKWIAAIHPLLLLSHRKMDKSVVPLMIQLDQHQRVLVISGPNAGGKSVCLKTVGLLQIMLQSGLLVPVHEESEFGTFDDVFIDIGDEQSIENDLSTYSSHLSNMKFFLKRGGDKSLILIDEFGTGTDPQFGGAIAEAILHELTHKKVFGVITTHYGNIKSFAEKAEGLNNGAMKYDMENLAPLYELEIGKPGSSFSLEIARKIGISHQVINKAKELMGSETIDLDKLILRLERQKQRAEQREIALKKREKEVKGLETKYQKLSTELEDNKKTIISRAKQEAASILKETNREIEKTIRHIKENKAEKKETKKARQRLAELDNKVQTKAPEKKIQKVEGNIELGSSVRIIGQEVAGEVISLKGNSAEVQFGDLKSTVKLNRLEKVSKGVSKQINKSRSTGKSLDLNQKLATFSSTLDVRGKRAEEVFSVVDRFIDDALLFGRDEVRILHGKGDGVLRKLIRDHLRASNLVAQMEDEHIEMGGAGITVVRMK